MQRVYIIAAYTHAPAVRALHDRLRMAGHEPTSSWAEYAYEPENLPGMAREEKRAAWRRNLEDMVAANVVIVLADTPAREGFLEAQRALSMGKRVLWVGRDTLTTDGGDYETVETLATVDAALEVLRG